MRSMPGLRCSLLAILAALFAGPAIAGSLPPAAPPIELAVDASQIARAWVAARETIPVRARHAAWILTLVYPKWLPGDHAPTGPISDLVNLSFTLPGSTTTLPWSRDPIDLYAFHIQVPARAQAIQAQFVAVGEYVPGNDFNLGNTATATQGDLLWNQLVLYPAGVPAATLRVAPQVLLPPGWSFATALRAPVRSADRVVFAPTDLATLVDSPVMMGSLFREFDLTPPLETRRHTLDVFGATRADLDVPPERIEALRALIVQTGLLFRSRHYEDYHFLAETQGSDLDDGLEHHQSADLQLPELGLVDPDYSPLAAGLFAHELTHSWNGKYRRPVGLATPDYQQPMDTRLVWIYEGLTEYWQDVLAARAGLETPEQVRENLAYQYAQLLGGAGRDWKPLGDVAATAPLLYAAPQQWRSVRRGTEFYEEGSMLWLEVDCLLRRAAPGAHGLDDFAASFYGGPSGPPALRPYTLDDVLKSLGRLRPYDWAGFFRTRVDAVRPVQSALQGIASSGWQLDYSAVPNSVMLARRDFFHEEDLGDSLGLLLDEHGEVTDVRPQGPAGRAGVVPQSQLIAVNHQRYSGDWLRQVLRQAQQDPAPIVLTLQRKGVLQELKVDYHGGERYPHLIRLADHPDLLDLILRARTP